MTIPSEKEFKNYIRLTQTVKKDAREVEPRLRMDVGIVKELLIEHWEGNETLQRALSKEAVDRWLTEGYQSQRAWVSLWGRKHLERVHAPDFDAIASRMVELSTIHVGADYFEGFGYHQERLNERLKEENSDRGKLARLARRIASHTGFNPFEISNGVAHAFYRYFYTESYKRYCKSLDHRIPAAKRLLDAADVLCQEQLWVDAGLEWLSGYSRARRRNLEEVAGADRKFPIDRVDSTVRERALAFELWSVFKRRFRRTNKTAAIYNFLLLDGVRLPPANERTVQRWIKAWVDDGIKPVATFDPLR